MNLTYIKQENKLCTYIYIRAGTNVNYQLRSLGCVIFELFEASCVLWTKLITVIDHNNVVGSLSPVGLSPAGLMGWHYRIDYTKV